MEPKLPGSFVKALISMVGSMPPLFSSPTADGQPRGTSTSSIYNSQSPEAFADMLRCGMRLGTSLWTSVVVSFTAEFKYSQNKLVSCSLVFSASYNALMAPLSGFARSLAPLRHSLLATCRASRSTEFGLKSARRQQASTVHFFMCVKP